MKAVDEIIEYMKQYPQDWVFIPDYKLPENTFKEDMLVNEKTGISINLEYGRMDLKVHNKKHLTYQPSWSDRRKLWRAYQELAGDQMILDIKESGDQ